VAGRDRDVSGRSSESRRNVEPARFMTTGTSINGRDHMAGPPAEGQTFGGQSLLARYASFVKLPHTLFALPFAGVGAVLASYTFPHNITVRAASWILVAFTAARFSAMGFNRIVDRHYDHLNPRTRMRELPAGRLSLAQAIIAVVGASALFVFSAFQ